MSPMAEMSRAIRLTLKNYGETLKDVPTDVLAQFAEIVQAFSLDLQEELARRK